MKKMLTNRKLWSVVFLAVVLLVAMSSMVFATTTVETFITDTLVANLKSIAGAFVVLAAIATAVLYMAGAVNPKLKDKGKEALYALIIGVIVLVLSDSIKGWIAGIANKS